MSTASVDAVIFAIQSAIKLGTNIRKAYANSLRSRRIVLPLPKFRGGDSLESAKTFFSGNGKNYLEEFPPLKVLHAKFSPPVGVRAQRPEGEDFNEYMKYFKLFFRVDNNPGLEDDEDTQSQIDSNTVISLLKIQQFEKGHVQSPNGLQLVAGSIVEIGIDYFSQTPGALNDKSSYGKVVKSFLTALDSVNFSEAEGFRSVANRVLPKLFIAAAESIGQLSEEVSNDERVQGFIKATGQKLAEDVKIKLKEGTVQDQENAIKWGQFMVHSMIKNAGTYVFSSSNHLLDDTKPATQLINATGSALLSAILDEEKVDLKAAFTAETLDNVVNASLGVIAENPDLISKNEAFQTIISQVCGSLPSSIVQNPDIVPEVIRTVLEKTAGNLDLLWDVKKDGATHLLASAAGDILTAISAPPSDGSKWRPSFTKSQLLQLTNDLMDEVITNPEWILQSVGVSSSSREPLLRRVLKIVFQALETVPKEQRLSFASVQPIIQSVMSAAVSNQVILGKINIGDDQEEEIILEQALNIVFKYTFGPKIGLAANQPQATKSQLILDLVAYTSNVVLSKHPDKKGLVLLKLILSDGFQYPGGFDPKIANHLLDSAIKVIGSNPELLSGDKILQSMIGDLSMVLQNSKPAKTQLLPDLVQLVLQTTALNMDLILKPGTNEAKSLLSLSVKQLLLALATPPNALGEESKWRLQLTNDQLLDISRILLANVQENPRWADKNMVQVFFEAVFIALDGFEEGEKIPYASISFLISRGMALTNLNRSFILPLDSLTSQSTGINYSLENLFSALKNFRLDETIQWVIGQTSVTNAMVDFFLTKVAGTRMSKAGIDTVKLELIGVIDLWKQQGGVSADDLIAMLKKPENNLV